MNRPAAATLCTDGGQTKVAVPVQFSPLTVWVVGGNMRDDSAEILFQSFLREVYREAVLTWVGLLTL